jgi:two-component sensor histidine kinase
MQGTTPFRSFTVRLPFDVRAAARARRLVLDLVACQRPSRSSFAEDAALVVDELVANALQHGAPDRDGEIEVSGQLVDRSLLLSVLDNGSAGTVAAQPFADDRDHGRGLSIVDALSTSWIVDRSHGTRVTARMRI